MASKAPPQVETPAAKVNWNVVPMADSPNTDTLWRGLRFRDPANIPRNTPFTTYDSATLRRVCWVVIAISAPLALLCLVALLK